MPHMVNRARHQAALQRREHFLACVEAGQSFAEACRTVGISDSGYRQWRKRWPEWAAKVDVARANRSRDLEGAGGDGKVPGFNARGEWAEGFGAFRARFFKMQSTWFHELAVQAYESTPPGNILLILWPPEHGKTTLAEDYFSYRLAIDPRYRISVGSEKQEMSRKILRRVKGRMEPQSPFVDFVTQFGPFVAQQGDMGSQPWGADYFNVRAKGGHDERDYSMVALGMTSAIAGTRTDHLHVDDPQSLKSIDQTEKLFETFRQDWLTRPGENGITTVNMTRVGEGDFAEMLMDEFDEDILKVIKFPALVYDEHREAYVPLWEKDPVTGAGWTMEQLERLKQKVGEDAWSRNYMQNPLASALKTFTDDVIQPTLSPLRAIDYRIDKGTPCVLSIDPGFGRNAIGAFAFDEGKLKVLDIVEDVKFTRTEQILDRLEELIVKIQRYGQGGVVTDVVIETMAFQKGLATDRQLRDMRDRYGFSVREHLTGVNKYDENIGLPTMARDMRLGRVDLPYADDPLTRNKMDELIRQLKAWKPKERGTKLRQDQVMVLWFAWILWRERRGHEQNDPGAFRFKGLPFRPTQSGLLTAGSR